MKVLIICSSTEHGNTQKLADAMAEELDAEVVTPGAVDPAILGDFELIGFGSGIRFGRHYRDLLDMVDGLPPQQDKKSFIFSTSGFGWRWWHSTLRRRLVGQGFEIRAEFCCKGLDTMGLFGLFGGMNKGRPGKNDLEQGRAFARSLLE